MSKSSNGSSIFANMVDGLGPAPAKEKPKSEPKPVKEKPQPKKEVVENKPVEQKPVVEKKENSVPKAKEGGSHLSMDFVLPEKKRVKERKSEQKTILVKPSQLEKVMIYAEEYGLSFNDFMCRMIDALPEP